MAAPTLRGGIHGRGRLVRVQRGADRGVANRVRHHLPPPPVELADQAGQGRRRHPRRAAVGGFAFVRIQHGRRPRLDNAVGHDLRHPGLEQRVVLVALAHFVERVEILGGGRGGHRQRLVDAHGHLAAPPQFVVELEIVGGAAGAEHAGDADAVGLDHGRAQRHEAFVTPGRRHRLADQAHRRLLEGAGRLAARVADDDPVGGIGCEPGDAGGAKGGGVGPAGMAIVRDQIGRAIGHQTVEHLPCRQSAVEGRVAPAPAADPRLRRVGLGPGAQGLLDGRARRRLVEVHLVEGQPTAQQVGMGIVEAGQDAAAAGIDDRRLRPRQALDPRLLPTRRILLPCTATASAPASGSPPVKTRPLTMIRSTGPSSLAARRR